MSRTITELRKMHRYENGFKKKKTRHSKDDRWLWGGQGDCVLKDTTYKVFYNYYCVLCSPKDPPANVSSVLQKLDSDYKRMRERMQKGVPLEQLTPLGVNSEETNTGASFIPANVRLRTQWCRKTVFLTTDVIPSLFCLLFRSSVTCREIFLLGPLNRRSVKRQVKKMDVPVIEAAMAARYDLSLRRQRRE